MRLSYIPECHLQPTSPMSCHVNILPSCNWHPLSFIFDPSICDIYCVTLCVLSLVVSGVDTETSLCVVYNNRSLVEELRKTLCSLWQGNQSAFSPDSLFYAIWKIMPSFRYRARHEMFRPHAAHCKSDRCSRVQLSVMVSVRTCKPCSISEWFYVQFHPDPYNNMP